MALADWGKKIGNLAQTSVEKSKNLAEIAKLNVANGNLEDDIKKAQTEIGAYVLQQGLLKEDAFVQEKTGVIDGCKLSIESNSQKIMALKDQNTCPGCGAVVSTQSKFCEKCGAPMPEPPVAEAPVVPLPVCTACGKPLPEGATFCGECGAPQNVQAPSQPEPVQQPVVEQPQPPEQQ